MAVGLKVQPDLNIFSSIFGAVLGGGASAEGAAVAPGVKRVLSKEGAGSSGGGGGGAVTAEVRGLRDFVGLLAPYDAHTHTLLVAWLFSCNYDLTLWCPLNFATFPAIV